jgi:uncharacterized protein with FMN-binding domain
MRRAALTLVATVAGLVLLLGYKTHGSAGVFRPLALAPTTPGATTPGATTPGQTTPSVKPSGSPAPSATSATRTVTGQTVDTQYGPVQVQITVAGGRITNVRPLQLPTSRGRDIEIDNTAVPLLIQETLQRQSAQIDMVSGATYTSEGYAQSLQSALDQLHG